MKSVSIILWLALFTLRILNNIKQLNSFTISAQLVELNLFAVTFTVGRWW